MKAFLIATFLNFVPLVAVADEVYIYGASEIGTIILIPEASQAEFTANLFIGAGAAEDQSFEGLAHFSEHRAFVGAWNETEYRGSINAFTNLKTTEFEASGDIRSFPDVMAFFAEVMGNHRITPEEFEVERQRIFREIEVAVSNPISRSEICQARLELFTQRPWKNCVLGNPDIIGELSQAALNEFQESYYTPLNSVLVVTGDVELGEVQRVFPPVGESRWSTSPLTSPDVSNFAPGNLEDPFNRFFFGYQFISLPEDLGGEDLTALQLILGLTVLDSLDAALEETLSGNRHLVRDYSLQIETLGADLAMISLSGELERGVPPELVIDGLNEAILRASQNSPFDFDDFRMQLEKQINIPNIYAQVLLVHLRERHAPVPIDELARAFGATDAGFLSRMTGEILSSEKWSFLN